MMEAAFVGFIGIVFIIFGYLLWKKERISLLHDYHYDKVSKEDKKAFCSISGAGIILIGIGLLITGVIIGITNSAWSFIAFAIGFFVGVTMLIYAGVRYNH